MGANILVKEPWNLREDDGLPNVYESIRRKLHYSGYQLEERSRTIINIESYEHTILTWALSEWAENHNVKEKDNGNDQKHEHAN